MKEISETKREDIRKVNKGNSFYDVMEHRDYKDKLEYQRVAGLTQPIFSKISRGK